MGNKQILTPYFMPYAKINARWIVDMNFKGKMIKLLLEDNIRR